MGKGDVLLSAPEFDTTRTQFCVSDALDDLFWAMAEADYACVSLLDMRQYSAVFRSFCAYLQNRSLMPARSYEQSPRSFDDDGNETLYSTYNQYGDYTLIRSGGPRDEMLKYYRADYTVDAFPQGMIESLNRVYREFQEQGVQVLFTYAPRNHSALTESSTESARRALHEHLQAQLCVPVIMDIEESLYAGQYFYLIDNHLSDEGVYMHNRKIIDALWEAGVN